MTTKHTVSGPATVVAALLLISCGQSKAPTTARVASVGAASSTTAATASPSSGREPTEAEANDALVRWTRCMRENGVDMPDPGADGTARVAAIGGANGPTPAQFEAAQSKCKALLPGGDSFTPRPEEVERMKAEMLAFAKCMREHGVEMADPTFDSNGGFSIGGAAQGDGATPAFGATPAAFEEASKACAPKDGSFSLGGAPEQHP